MAEDHECDVCGRSFSTKRGLGVHKAQMHTEAEETKEELMLLQLIEDGKAKVSELAESLGMEEKRIQKRVNDLVEKEFVREKVEEGRDAIYDLTDQGRERIEPLVNDIVSETKSFVQNIRDAFSEHLGDSIPRIRIEWPEKDDEEDRDS